MTNTPLRPARSAPAARGPEPAKRRSKAPWLVGGALVVVVAGAGAYAATRHEKPVAAPVAETTTAAAATTPPVEPALTVLPVGRKASEGTLSVAVTKTECGLTEVGPPDLPLAAEGEFCLVSVAVQNTGKEPRLLDPGAQRALDRQGRSYRVAEQAAVFVNDQDPSLLDEIPPGAIRQGVVPFDVPKGVTLTSLMVHKSPYSTGVRVQLS
ncbi:DUF4352 domain-containing protein [Actinoplanes sp. LDG1-06]|uniref:DUF4352 domain-containing protein n=1 Tax=Paractinoplanes ovalisporus TaxID=2810368 RepID=A0ABS2AB04_9ACTN|nr:DUF4352 domain-containing protein [Actinoplanes ovalisporus]MBM2617010.1 DUF4352 domain-containing protein [Actinoplanes ovalisporus]